MRLVLHLQKSRRKIIQAKRARRRRSSKGQLSFALWQPSPKTRFYRKVELWDGDEPVEAICIRRPVSVPDTMCLESRLEDTLSFIDGIRTRMMETYLQGGKNFIRRKKGRKPVIHGYADFSSVNYISTSAALILAAEYDRIRKRVNKVPPAVNLHEWSDAAFSPLFEIGFFDTVGLSDDAGQKMYILGERKTLRIVSMDEGDNKLNILDAYLEDLYDFVFPGATIPEDLRVNIITSVSEAISNVAEHAYADQSYDYKIAPINRSWITASADRNNKSLTVVVFDQGAGIPYTYPRQKLVDSVKTAVNSFLQRFAGGTIDSVRDDAYIEAAMRYGNSRTNLAHRGKGLPQMSDLIDQIGNGNMAVYSGSGWWRKDTDGTVTTGVTSTEVGGTLIDWTIKLGDSINEV